MDRSLKYKAALVCRRYNWEPLNFLKAAMMASCCAFAGFELISFNMMYPAGNEDDKIPSKLFKKLVLPPPLPSPRHYLLLSPRLCVWTVDLFYSACRVLWLVSSGYSQQGPGGALGVQLLRDCGFLPPVLHPPALCVLQRPQGDEAGRGEFKCDPRHGES